MPLNVKQALSSGIDRLSKTEISDPRLDVEILLSHAIGMDRENIFINFDRELTKEEQTKYGEYLSAREQYLPVARILGSKEFWSLDFKLNEHTLIPSPDSESLVEAVVSKFKAGGDYNILDFGTGSGCLLLAILSELKGSQGVGVDAEPLALNAAQNNAKNLKLDGRSKFINYSWLSDREGLLEPKAYDIIVSNPPYIESNDIAGLQRELSEHGPMLALDGGVDGMVHYKALAKVAKKYLAKNGCFFLEIGFGQAQQVEDIFNKQGWLLQSIYKDIQGIERALAFKQQ